MRAITFNGKDAVLKRDRKSPAPQPGEAIVRPVRLAVGRLDVEIARGLMNFRGVLGREFVGVVESVTSPGDPKLKGKRVVGSIVTACGQCDLCQKGLSAHCRNQAIMGFRGRDGCFADAFAIPAANLFVVSNAVDDDHAVFAQLLACAMQPTRQITIEGKPYITVLGDGPLGLLTAQVMSKLNASVRMIGKHPEKFSLCEKWGVKHRHVDDIGRRADQDIVVDCTGSPVGFDLACKLVRPRGKVIVKTLNAAAGSRLSAFGQSGQSQPTADSRQPTSPLDWTPIVMNEIEVIGSGFGPVGDALTAIAKREVDVINLISKRMKLADGVGALKTAAQQNVLRVLMEP